MRQAAEIHEQSFVNIFRQGHSTQKTRLKASHDVDYDSADSFNVAFSDNFCAF